MKSDVGQRGKLLLSSFIEFLRVRVCVVMLPAYCFVCQKALG